MSRLTCCFYLLPLSLCALDSDSAPQLFSKVAERNQVRESQLRNYSVVRTYQVRNSDDRVRSESKVLVQYTSPNPKVFKILEEHGSHVIGNMVFRPLMDHEIKATSIEAKRDTSITPANYNVELKGEDELDGRHCYLLYAVPRRRDKYLFEGTIWIDAEDLAVAQIVGQPAKNPSFWVKKVQFTRRYQKIGDFWMPKEDTSVSEVKIFGKHTLTIRYEEYKLNDPGPAAAVSKVE